MPGYIKRACRQTIAWALLMLIAVGCSSVRDTVQQQPPPPGPTTWPAITQHTGTRVATSDPAYDADGDGYADTFVPTVAAISPALTTTSIGSSDGGDTFVTLEFLGGAAFEPSNAVFDSVVSINIPVDPAASLAVGSVMTVWLFTDAHTTNQLDFPGGNLVLRDLT